jgi:peptidoglycan/LPS O-acetylase OafA/YrhL
MTKSIDASLFNRNNFDLIRLFASAQVAHYHIFHIMDVKISDFHSEIMRFLGFFPGVPIFFFISGFLISRSWLKNPNLKHYIANRVLRIYPGLIMAVTLSFVLINLSGYVAMVRPTISELVILFLAKSSILQFYNPDFMRGYGDGVMNGSLWTITVELQFYAIIPILFLLLSRLKERDVPRVIALLIGLFLVANMLYNQAAEEYSDHIFFKLFKVSFIPWFYMFLLGIFFQLKFKEFHHFFKGKAALIFIGYVSIALIHRHLGGHFGNSINPLVFFALACLTFSSAYTFASLSERLLRGSDMSYGLYIYHMPFVNVAIFITGLKSYPAALAVAGVVILMSCASWFLIERNALKLKPKSMRQV